MTRELQFATGPASSWDPATRQFEAVIVSGPGVVATASDGTRVQFNAAGLDDSGIRGGTVPLLSEHNRHLQLGKVLSLNVAGGRATVRCCLDPIDTYEPEADGDDDYDASRGRAALRALEKRLEAGTQTGFSMRVTEIELNHEGDNSPSHDPYSPPVVDAAPLTVTAARITEVSATTMPGDPGATALSAPDSTGASILEPVSSGIAMPNEPKNKDTVGQDGAVTTTADVALSAPTQEPEPAPAASTQDSTSAPATAPTLSLSSDQLDALADRVVDRQAKRNQRFAAEVDSVVAEYKLSAEQRQELLNANVTGVELYKRAHAFDNANRDVSLSAPVPARTSGVQRNSNQAKEVREAAFSVLEDRLAGKMPDKEASKLFHPWDIPSFLDIAQGLAMSQGGSLGNGGPLELAFSALVRDDLPDIFRELVNKRLRESPAPMAPIYSRLSVRRPVRDYSTILTAASGGMRLSDREEGAETRNSVIAEEGTTYRPVLSDTQKTLSHQTVVGDDIGWLQDLTASAPRAVMADLEKKFHESFTNNPQFDGAPAFSTARGNARTAANLSANELQAAVADMEKQVDLTGNPANLMPRFLLVPSEQIGRAKQVLNARQGQNILVNGSEVSVEAGNIIPISSPWLSNANVAGNSANNWYLFADPAMSRSIEHAVLESQPGPYFQTRTELNRDLTFYLANTGAFALANPRGIIRGTAN